MRWKLETQQSDEHVSYTLCFPEDSPQLAAVVEILTRHGTGGPWRIVITQEQDPPAHDPA